MTNFVLDASAGFELLFETPIGLKLQRLLPTSAEWWVPEHYYVEVSGILRRAELNNVFPLARVQRAFDRLAASPIHRVQVRPLLADAWAKRHNITIADAIYVALAEHIGATLVTGDIKLANTPNLLVPTIHP